MGTSSNRFAVVVAGILVVFLLGYLLCFRLATPRRSLCSFNQQRQAILGDFAGCDDALL